MNKDYSVTTTRTYFFDEIGNFAMNKQGSRWGGLWEISVGDRELLIPDIAIQHLTNPQNGSGTVKHFLPSVDGRCVCGSSFPLRILDSVYSINRDKFKHCYGAVEHSGYYSLEKFKKLSEEWYLDEKKEQKEPSIFHVCNDNHPAYLYYGKGIPLSQIAMPPWPDKCKTCRVDIPTGVRIASLMFGKRKLKI